MKKTIVGTVFFYLLLVLFSCTSVSGKSDAETVQPGSYENAAHKGLDKVLLLDKKLNQKNDELIIYYVRSDKNYAPWALWIWATPGGNGNDLWNFSQKWQVKNGIAYMKFALDGHTSNGICPVSTEGKVGLIVRKRDSWIKDGNDDRIWNIGTSHKVVIFSGDDNTYPVEAYNPSIISAEQVSDTTINLVLSGKYALDYDGGVSGFNVSDTLGNKFEIAKVCNTENPDDPKHNFTKNISIILKNNISMSDSLVITNTYFRGVSSVNNIKFAVKTAEKTIPTEKVKLGVTYNNKSAVFRLWAPTSSSGIVNIYKLSENKTPDYTEKMTLDKKNGVWAAVFNTVDPDGLFYDYTLTNSKGTVTVLDPYAESMSAGKGRDQNCKGAIVNLNSYKALPSDGMNQNYITLKQREDAVIYEMSVRDFTISPDSDVKAEPGTYKAFIEKIPYLASLGITHVQLMPVLNFYFTDETNKKYENSGKVSDCNYNWGYDPYNYFTPEGWYATDPKDPYCRIKELRELINACHKAKIGVLLDVVYNHMANIKFLDDIVPGYYFRTNFFGKLKNKSGCGNDTATERKMMKRLIVDSTSYWVKNYKVDGFRFDIMGLIESSAIEEAYKACAVIDPDILFEGEGWKLYNGPVGTVGMDQGYMTKTDHAAVFNDQFRDLLKAGGYNETGCGFITGKPVSITKLFENCLGNPTSYKTDIPGDNLQYIASHDGLTLHDVIAHNLNLDESDPAQKKELIQRIKLGNFFELTSQGIAFLHGGQERGRTKPNFLGTKNESVGNFVRNSYDAADNINQFVWTLDSDYKGLLSYTKGLIALRKHFNVFRIADQKTLEKRAKKIIGNSTTDLLIAYYIEENGKKWIICANGKMKKVEIPFIFDSKTAEIYVDSEKAGIEKIENPKGVVLTDTSIHLDPLCEAVILLK